MYLKIQKYRSFVLCTNTNNHFLIIKFGNGSKRSESGFDMNKTNPFLSISIHLRLLGVQM